MNCGDVVDSVTEHNRKAQAQGLVDVMTVKRTVQYAKIRNAASAQAAHRPVATNGIASRIDDRQ